MKTRIQTQLEMRLSAKEFIETDKYITDEQRDNILDAARLTPTSFNLQPFKLVWLTRERLLMMPQFIYGKQQSNALGCVVVISKSNGDDASDWSETIKASKCSTISPKWREKASEQLSDEWSSNQSYIPLMSMLLSAAEMGISSCPIEGFKPTLINWLEDFKWFAEPEDCEDYFVEYCIMFGRTDKGSLTTVNNVKVRDENLAIVL